MTGPGEMRFEKCAVRTSIPRALLAVKGVQGSVITETTLLPVPKGSHHDSPIPTTPALPLPSLSPFPLALTGTLSGYFFRIFSPSFFRYSKGWSSLYWNFMMDRRVSKIPGRGLPSSLMVACLPSPSPPPNFGRYENRLRNVSSRRNAAWQSSQKGCRGPSDAGRTGSGREIPAAFPESPEHKNNAAARWHCDVMTSRLPTPPPAFGPRRVGGRNERDLFSRGSLSI